MARFGVVPEALDWCFHQEAMAQGSLADLLWGLVDFV